MPKSSRVWFGYWYCWLGSCGLFSVQPVLAVSPQMPVVVNAADMQQLWGLPVDQLHGFIWEQDHFQPRPVQVTQLTDVGSVYSPGMPSIPMSGEPDLFDATDRVEFIFEDMGLVPCQEKLASLSVGLDQVIQIEVIDSQYRDAPRYLCFGEVSDVPIAPAVVQDHVVYDPLQNMVRSDYYQLTFFDDNPLIWRDLYCTGVNLTKTGEINGDSLLDMLKVVIDVGLFSHYSRVRLDHRDLETAVIDVQHGPVFDSLFAETAVKLAGARVLTMQVMVYFYPSHVEMSTRFKVPAIAKWIVKSPRFDVSLDGNNLWGSQVRASWGPETAFTVDGVLDEQESQFTQVQVQGQDTWVWVSTRRGFDLVAMIEFDERFDVPIGLVYDDDRTKFLSPERFMGQGPNVGYSVRGMVVGRYFMFNTTLVFSRQIDPHTVPDHVKAIQQPWQVRLSSSRNH